MEMNLRAFFNNLFTKYIFFGIIEMTIGVYCMRKNYQKQSLWSKFIDFSLGIFYSKKNSSSTENAKRFINKSFKKKLKTFLFHGFNKETVDEYLFYTYNGTSRQTKNKVIVYLHGGNYVEHPNIFQISFAKKIARKTNSTLIFPIYELLPFGNYKKMHDLLTKIYSIILENSNVVVNFLGDSAGAGSILAFAQYISCKDILQPENIILLSPWVDLSMSNPQLYEDAKFDKMNDVDGTRYEGKLWSYDLDPTHPYVSPIYGNFDKIKKISIIFGGRGILVSECKRFDEILTKAHVNHDFIMFENEGHDFALFPTKEGRLAINYIVEIIGRV